MTAKGWFVRNDGEGWFVRNGGGVFARDGGEMIAIMGRLSASLRKTCLIIVIAKNLFDHRYCKNRLFVVIARTCLIIVIATACSSSLQGM